MAAGAESTDKKALRISHLWLYSKDTAKSIRFYRDVLDFRVVESFPDGALLQGGGILLGIHREEGDRKSKAGGTLLVLQTNNIERSFEELKQKGVKFLKPQIEKAVFGAVADFKDPDEYLLEIWQPPAR
jgi:catechol 2,3-dioxygenase-like lactoylglutathione lyase family enzyme